METQNQEKVWDNIAPEWHEFKQIPARHVKEFLDNSSGNVLDLGAGSGRHFQKIKNGKMFLLDFSQEMLNLAEEKAKNLNISIETKKADLFKIPYEDNFFDFAICISALHCIDGEENRVNSIKELYRVLKPGAKALIGVWNHKSKRFGKDAPKEKLINWQDKGQRYYYLYDEDEVHKQFQDTGFKILSSINSEMMINFIVEKL